MLILCHRIQFLNLLPISQANLNLSEKDQIIISPDVRDLIQGEFELQKFVPKKSIQSYAGIGPVPVS
jgi:hypothetical protein